MRFLRSFASSAVLAAAVLGGAVAANATTATYCPGTSITTDREFTVTTNPAATCLGFGSGNANANNPSFATFLTTLGSNVTLLDKTDDGADPLGSVIVSATNIGGLSGLFSILVPTGYNLINTVLVLKSGNGTLNPDWAAFGLANGVVSGSWSIAAGNQSLSHADVYGTLVPAPIPVPASGLLLASLLGGLALAGRRKKPA